MLHHTSSEYTEDAPAGYTFSQQRTMDDPCVGLGCDMFKKGKVEKYKMNYYVPNFGADPDMETTQKSINIAEDATGQKLVMGTPESKAKWKNAADKTKYDFNPKVEGDVVDSANSLNAAEGELGHKLSSPESNVQLASDPCWGDSCSRWKLPSEKETWKKDYAVPSFGADPDMEGTMNSLKIAEKQENHELEMGTADSKAKWKIVAKLTPYDYYPKLESDVISTQRHIANAEDRLGATLDV